MHVYDSIYGMVFVFCLFQLLRVCWEMAIKTCIFTLQLAGKAVIKTLTCRLS